jgi:DNA topoisomerase-2
LLYSHQGGRHGYGAKLTNIFSKSFTVETVDSRKKRYYKQSWYDNMTKASDPEISDLDTKTEDYTCITFVPDLARLTGDPHAVAIDEQDYAIMCRRVVDAAGCAAGKLRVALNGQDVSMESFADYSRMYRKEDSSELLFHDINSRWEVGIGLSENHSFDSISFVNGMATPRGGTHINVIVNQVVKKIQEKASKSDPELANLLTSGLIKRNLFLCVNALIENPTFDSQMKEFMTSNPSSFGSSYTLSERFLSELVKSEEDGGPGIVEEVLRVAKGRQQANLFKQVGGKKSKRQLLSIPKLDDAHGAGSDSSSNCTLILTEGDSAKALAVAGLEVIGRKNFGVFPLRGKFLNVRHASVDQLANNAEVKALIAILGLDFDKEYDTVEERAELRYGKIMVMTDQDTDGSHIKGLVINFFRHFWPKLLKPTVDEPLCEPFMASFFTPLIKVTKKKEKHSFYSMADYNAWRSSHANPEEIKQWKIKYYKGLGTSTPAEAKEYFSDFDKHHRPFHWNSELDGELLDKVFDKERAADRRDWISDEYDPESAISFDEEDTSITYEDFVNKEMIHFSHADNIRSIPNSIDGLKPSQRKVLFSCFKRKLKSEIKVAQLSGYCAEHTAYHHGEASLQGTSEFEKFDKASFQSLPFSPFPFCSKSSAWLKIL